MARNLTREDVIQALRNVLDPDLKRDLVSLDMIKDVVVNDDNAVSFTIELTTPACPLKNKIKNDALAAVASIDGVGEIQIEMSARVRADGFKREINLSVRNIVAVGSGKGGVGKSTVSTNLALALAQSGASVGLLDADIYGPNIPTMMGVVEPPHSNGTQIVPSESYGVKIISIGFFVHPDQPLIWRGPMLHNTIRQFVTDVDWGPLDYLIIDLPPGTGDIQLSLTQTLPLSGGLIVTLPQKISLEDARRGVMMYRKLNIPVLGIVENMSYLEMADGSRMDIFGTGGGASLAEETDSPFLGEIPMDPQVRVGGDTGVPILVSDPEKPAAMALRAIAEKLAVQLSVNAITNADVVMGNA